MARKIIRYFDVDSMPKEIKEDGKTIKITGVFTKDRPRSLWCRCGYEDTSYKTNRDYRMNFEGCICPQCNVKHSNESVMQNFGYYGDSQQFVNLTFDGTLVTRTFTRYKLVLEEDKFIKIVQLPSEVTRHTIADAHDQRILCNYLIEDIVKNYADSIDPTLKELFEIALSGETSGPFYYYGNPALAKDLKDNNPILFIPLMETLRGEPIRYAKFESMYPEYLLPLTKQLLKDYNPVEERKRRWGSPIPWPSFDQYENIEAVTCVVSYYKSGLISFDQMKNLLLKVDALNNPTFVRAFKANYLQMFYLLSDLEAEKVNLRYACLDTKTYYRDKTNKFFIDYGLTQDQINYCFANAKNGVQLLNLLGSQRKKRGTGAAAKAKNP